MFAATTAAPRFPKLKLGNWATWEADMSAHLRSKGLMGHVTGLIVLNAQLWDDAHTLCSTENKRVNIEQRLVYTPAAQRISE